MNCFCEPSAKLPELKARVIKELSLAKLHHSICTMINESSDFNLTEIVKKQERIYVSAFYAILSIIGLALEIFILYIVFKQKGVRLSLFYMFLVSVVITESVAFQLYLLYASPCVMFATQIYGDNFGTFLGNFETVDFLALVLITFCIALNRALSISGSEIYHKIFTHKLVLCYIAGSWILATVAVLVDIALGCKTAFLENDYYFAEQCGNQSPALTATSLTIYIGVYAVALLYAYCIWTLWKHRGRIGDTNLQMRDNISKRNRLLFYQALCIWLTLFVNVISFRIIPEFLKGLPAVMLTALIVLGTNFISPICMLVFNSEMRVAAKNILLCRDISYSDTRVSAFVTSTNVMRLKRMDSQAK